MNYELFNKIVIGIATIALSFTAIVYLVYFLGIGTIWKWVYDQASPITATATVVLALTSIVVALVGFFAYFRENEKNRIEKTDKDNRDRLLVKPLLTAKAKQTASKKDKGKLREELNVENCGNGPAIIKNFILEINGKETARKEITRNDVNKNHEFLEENKRGFYFDNVGFMHPDSVLRAGDSQNLYAFEYKGIERNKMYLNPKINIRIEYQSIYEDEVFIFNTNRFAD